MQQIEDFLKYGGFEKPESRATKADLERHVKERDELLETIREVLLGAISNQIETIEKPVEQTLLDIDNLTGPQLNALVGAPNAQLKYKFFDTGQEVCDFCNEIGSHNVVSICSANNQNLSRSKNTDSGVVFIVFYRE